MAMNPARMVLYFFGILLVAFAVVIFFFAGGLDRWIPVSMLVAGILLIIGLAVMGFADTAPAEGRRGASDDGDVTIVKK